MKGNRVLHLLALAALVAMAMTVLPACHRMLPGKIISQTDGTVLKMKIQRKPSSGPAKVTAYNPKTKEKFKGEYTVIQGRFENDVANAKGFLNGKDGTIITMDLQIQPGKKPKGVGEAMDNKGNNYQVQFGKKD